MTQLCVYADFTSHPPAMLAALPSNPPLLPFPHPALLLLSSCWTNPLFHPPPSPHILHHSASSLVQLQLCVPLPVHLFSLHPHIPPQSTLLLFPLRQTLADSQGSFRGWFWQPSVELIHELVLGQCNQPLFVAHYQLPGAEPFNCRTMAFCCVIAQLSPTQRERKQMLGKPGIRIQVHRQHRERK